MTGLLGETSEGLVFIISAPAGTGKTTLVRKLVQEFSSVIASISYTTRKPRDKEISGVDYYFISQSEFESKIAANDFLEYVSLYGNYYGTSRQWVNKQQKQGKHVVLVIDTQGALKLKGLLSATFIFIQPPSLEALRMRLTQRQTEDIQTIEKRLIWAKRELGMAEQYDYRITNDDLNLAYQVLRSIVIAECHRLHVHKPLETSEGIG